MDSLPYNSHTEATFLRDCVSNDMSAGEAAASTHACWTEAEEALAPVIGRDGLGVVFRHGEKVAERNLGLEARAAHASSEEFFHWVRSLSKQQALTACKSFLLSVENFLVSLIGPLGVRRLLRPSRRAASRGL